MDWDKEFRAAARLVERPSHMAIERSDKTTLTTDDFLVKVEAILPDDWVLILAGNRYADGTMGFKAVAHLHPEGEPTLQSEFRRRPDEALEDIFLQLRDL